MDLVCSPCRIFLRTNWSHCIWVIYLPQNMKKSKAVGNKKYTLLSHVTYSEYRGWSQNKKKAMYVVPKLKKKTWKDNVDEIYIGGHLVNAFQGTQKKTPNVAFSYFFQIYSTQNIKAGDELLGNHNRRYNIGNLKK